MRRGAWHQCGDRSQKLAQEVLAAGAGVGVIVSPRDLSYEKATSYFAEYRALGAEVLVDPQYYVPDFESRFADGWPTDKWRATVASLSGLSAQDLDDFSTALESVNRAAGACAVIAPAAVYEAGRNDIMDLNRLLFGVAKRAGDAIGIPTLATVVVGATATGSATETASILTHTTSLAADGWYYAFEFNDGRIPSTKALIRTSCAGLLTLATTGRPVIHAYAGPLGLLSFAFGATGAGVGHSQNLWQFTRTRWIEQPKTGGGGGDAPPRFFSGSLWGTIISPDELVMVPGPLLTKIMTHSPFSTPLQTGPIATANWPKWDANKHLVHVIAKALDGIAASKDLDMCAKAATRILDDSIALHGQLTSARVALKDESQCRHQPEWKGALTDTLAARKDDFEYLKLLM